MGSHQACSYTLCERSSKRICLHCFGHVPAFRGQPNPGLLNAVKPATQWLASNRGPGCQNLMHDSSSTGALYSPLRSTFVAHHSSVSSTCLGLCFVMGRWAEIKVPWQCQQNLPVYQRAALEHVKVLIDLGRYTVIHCYRVGVQNARAACVGLARARFHTTAR